MSNSRSRATYWISTWWPVALAVAIICCESTDFMGADHTTAPFRRLFEALFGPVSEPRWETIHYHIRKAGHFLGYGFVGLTLIRAWRRIFASARFLSCALIALLSTFLIAGGDELHQSYLTSRTGKFSDVLLDTCGALALITVDYLLLRILQRESLWGSRTL